MIECIFTLDYEIYGNGHGALDNLVYEPTKRLSELFLRRGIRFVNYVEVAELDKIEECGTDVAIDLVKRQIRDLCKDDFEIALHLHPQWYNARHEHGRWLLDSSEYNLCTLPRPRIDEIVQRSLSYLRHLVDKPAFTPLSFRAGNWLFQPTHTAASVLAEKGLRIDSSVFKGGLQHNHGLDYRRSLRNGDYWRFGHDVNEPDPGGQWIEVPIYAEMVPLWKMPTSKRMAFNKPGGATRESTTTRFNRLRDFLRFRYPLKFDFCRMTLNELTSMVDRIILEDRRNPDTLRPVVAIGHTKDLRDVDTVAHFLSYVAANKISVSTFADVYQRLTHFAPAVP